MIELVEVKSNAVAHNLFFGIRRETFAFLNVYVIFQYPVFQFSLSFPVFDNSVNGYFESLKGLVCYLLNIQCLLCSYWLWTTNGSFY